MSDPIREQLLSEIAQAIKWVRDIEDKCVFNHSLPIPTDGIEKIPHPEIVIAHRYVNEVVVPAADFMTTKWLMIASVVRGKMREPEFKDTLKLFKVHYDNYLAAIAATSKPLLFDKAASTKVIRTAVRKIRAAEVRKPRAPKPKPPPKVRLMDGWKEACDVARFQRNLEDQDHERKRKRQPRNQPSSHPEGSSDAPHPAGG